MPGTYAFASQASLFANRLGGGRAVEVDLSGSDLRELVGAGLALMGAIKRGHPRRADAADPLARARRARSCTWSRNRGETAGLRMGGAELGQAVDALVDGSIIGEWGKEGEAKVDVVLRALVARADPDSSGPIA